VFRVGPHPPPEVAGGMTTYGAKIDSFEKTGGGLKEEVVGQPPKLKHHSSRVCAPNRKKTLLE
jgi:hypothetical protein